MATLKLKLLTNEGLESAPGHYSDTRALETFQLRIDGKISKHDAAKQLPALALPAQPVPKARHDEVGCFCLLLHDMAHQISYDHSAQAKLVHLIHLLSESPDLRKNVTDSHEYEVSSSMEKSWLGEPDDPIGGDPYITAVNYAAFLARLTQCGFLFNSSIGIYTMRQRLEETASTQLGSDATVNNAALWVSIAGQSLYSQIVEDPNGEIEGSRYMPGPLYKGAATGLER